MQAKPIIVTLLASYFSFLASGLSWLVEFTQNLLLGFLMRNQVHRVLMLILLALILRYLWQNKLEDELPIILGIVGSFLIFVGSLIGPSTVLIGMIVLFAGILYQEHIYIRLQSPRRR